MLKNPWGLTLVAGEPFRLACGAVLLAGDQQVMLVVPSGMLLTITVLCGNVEGSLVVLDRKIEQAGKVFGSPFAAAARELSALRSLSAVLEVTR